MQGDNKNIVMMKARFDRIKNAKNSPLYFKGVEEKKRRLYDFMIRDQTTGDNLIMENMKLTPIA